MRNTENQETPLNFKITLLPGDGIGPEVLPVAVEAARLALAAHNVELRATTSKPPAHPGPSCSPADVNRCGNSRCQWKNRYSAASSSRMTSERLSSSETNSRL